MVITSSKLQKTYEYKNESVVVNGSIQQDAATGELQNINGSCYKPGVDGGVGDYIGNFNGYERNGEILYSLSEMSRRNMMIVYDAIDEIEQYIKENE